MENSSENSLTMSEIRSLESIMVRNVNTGAIQWPNVELLMIWQGWNSQDAARVMAERPCRGFNYDGVCGAIKDSWCVSCSETIAQLGAGWNLPVMTASIISVLREHAIARRYRVKGVHWKWSWEPHDCRPNCPKNRSFL
jgi:hypothetical protein